jgi:peroxin-5
LKRPLPFSHSIPQWQPSVPLTQTVDTDTIAAAIDALQLDRSTTQSLELNPSAQVASDDLAKTAGLLVDSVKSEANPKFQNSTFLRLMRQIRDGEVVVDGDVLKESDQASGTAIAVDPKGKGKARQLPPSLDQPLRKSVHFDPSLQQLENSSAEIDSESELDRYLRLENEEYKEIWSAHDNALFASRIQGALANITHHESDASWGALQADWEKFEATATGIHPVTQYTFDLNNPWLQGTSTRHHSFHEFGMQGVGVMI